MYRAVAQRAKAGGLVDHALENHRLDRETMAASEGSGPARMYSAGGVAARITRASHVFICVL